GAHLAAPRLGAPRSAVLPGGSRDSIAARGGGTAAVTREPMLSGGIIAAGEGTRLRQAGWMVPKPMVPVAGVPLIESTIRNFMAAGITRLSIILNEQEAECAGGVQARFPALELRLIVKTTASSLESFREVTRGAGAGRMLVSTVDAWCRPPDFAGFVDAARRRPHEA